MSLTQTLRTLAAATGLALTLGGIAWAQEEAPATDEGTAVEGTAVEAPATDEGAAVEAAPAEEAAPAADEEAPAEEGGAPDESGNMNDEAAPEGDAADAADASEAEVAVGDGLPVIGEPLPGGIALQPAVTSVAANVHWLDSMVLWIITAIVLFVTALIVWVVYRYNERRNATPARFTHNSPLEIAWTIVPIVILVFIGAFSLPVLFDQQEIPEGDVHIKATGFQWFWNYEYPDEGISFDSYMIGYGQGNLNPEISAELAAAGFTDAQFKLATDTSVIVPVGATVVMTITGGDVIHSWKVPAFGVMQDAVPGRLAHLWFRPEQEGIYFGQCSELCGKDHAFMPIQVRVVSQEEYDAWVAANGTPAEDAPES